jgi:hypothetical protein
MADLGMYAQACWDDDLDAFHAVLVEPFDRYRLEPEARGVHWAISTLCACVALAEALHAAHERERYCPCCALPLGEEHRYIVTCADCRAAERQR